MPLNGRNKCEFWMCWNTDWNQKDVKHDVQFENAPNYCSAIHDQMAGKAHWFESFLGKAFSDLKLQWLHWQELRNALKPTKWEWKVKSRLTWNRQTDTCMKGCAHTRAFGFVPSYSKQDVTTELLFSPSKPQRVERNHPLGAISNIPRFSELLI